MARSWGDEAGFSLVEVLISVVIIGICFAGLLGGMATSALTSGIHRSQADGHVLLLSAAESLKDEARNPFSCSTASYDPFDDGDPDGNPGTISYLPPGWSTSSLQVVQVEHGHWSTGNFVNATCGTGTDLQRLHLRAVSPDGRSSELLTFFKRRP